MLTDASGHEVHQIQQEENEERWMNEKVQNGLGEKHCEKRIGGVNLDFREVSSLKDNEAKTQDKSRSNSLLDGETRGGEWESKKGSLPERPSQEATFRPTGRPSDKDSPANFSESPIPSPPLEAPKPETTYPEGGLRAWGVVFGSFAGMTASFGLMNTVGTFQAYLSTHQLASYDPSVVGWIFGLYVFLAFFCGLQIGPMFDAKGPRWLIAAGSLCMLGAAFGLAESTEFWHFILTFSILGGVGTSLIFTPAVGSIGHFFLVNRGSATGLAATGGSVGGIVFPLLLPKLWATVGYAWGTRIIGFMMLFLLIFANLLIRSRLPPKVGGSVWPDLKIFRDKVFAFTTAGVFFVEWGLFIPLSYLASYALHYGISYTFAYQLLAITNVGSFFGRWLPGYVADKWGRFNCLIVTVLLCLVTVLGIWLPTHGNVAATCIFALCFGFASGSNISLTPVCVGQLCDTEEYGRYYATCYTIVSFGCLTGIPIAGQILAVSGGEYWGLILFTGMCYLCGLLCFTTARVMSVGWNPRTIY